MTGIAYLAVIFAMLWLGFWLIQSRRSERRAKPTRRSKLRWWPFEYREEEPAAPEAAEQIPLSGWRSRAELRRRPR